VHIIRLDEIREGYISFNEIQVTLVKQLRQEYRDAKLVEYRDSFSLGKSTKINPVVLERILNDR